MTFQEFKCWFSKIEDWQEEFDIANNAIKDLCPSSYAVIELGTALFDAYISLLESKFNSKDEWIAYYVYECDSGKSPNTVINGKQEIKLDSLEKLYMLLTAI